MEDPLKELLASENSTTDKSKLAGFLKPYISIDNSSQTINLLDEFHSLKDGAIKIKVLLTATKAKSLLFNSEEGISPKEIIDLGIMPEGTVKSTLKRLMDKREVSKNSQGKYILPPYLLNKFLESKI